MMLSVSDDLFLFVSAGCAQLVSPGVAVMCVQAAAAAILLTASQLVYTKILISSHPRVQKCKQI